MRGLESEHAAALEKVLRTQGLGAVAHLSTNRFEKGGVKWTASTIQQELDKAHADVRLWLARESLITQVSVLVQGRQDMDIGRFEDALRKELITLGQGLLTGNGVDDATAKFSSPDPKYNILFEQTSDVERRLQRRL